MRIEWKKLMSSFYQVFTLTVFLELIFVYLFLPSNIEGNVQNFLFRIIGIALVYAILYGVLHPLVWRYLKLNRVVVFLFSALVSTAFFSIILLLAYTQVTSFMTAPLLIGCFILTTVIYMIVFEVMSYIDNFKTTKEMNKLLQNLNE